MDLDGIVEVCDALGLLVGRPYSSDKYGPNVSISCPLAPWTHGDPVDSNKSCSVTIDVDNPSKARCHSFSCGYKGHLWFLVQRAVKARNPIPQNLIDLVTKIAKTEEPSLDRDIDRVDMTTGPTTVMPTETYMPAALESAPIVFGSGVSGMAAMPRTRETVIKLFERDVLDERSLDAYTTDLPAYVFERGITVETAKFWELRYDDRLGRVVFPVRRMDSRLIGLTGRILPAREAQAVREGWDVTKYHNYSGLNKTRYLYGAHTWKKGLPCVLTEGPFDLLKTWQAIGDRVNVGATLGQGFASDHRRTVKSFEASGAYLFFDDDSAGRLAAEKVGAQLDDAVPLYIMRIEGGKDPGAMADAAIVRSYESAYGPIIGDILAALGGADPLA